MCTFSRPNLKGCAVSTVQFFLGPQLHALLLALHSVETMCPRSMLRAETTQARQREGTTFHRTFCGVNCSVVLDRHKDVSDSGVERVNESFVVVESWCE